MIKIRLLDEAFFKVSEHVFEKMFKGLTVLNYGISASMRHVLIDLNRVLRLAKG